MCVYVWTFPIEPCPKTGLKKKDKTVIEIGFSFFSAKCQVPEAAACQSLVIVAFHLG